MQERNKRLHQLLKTQGSIQAEPFLLEMTFQPQNNNNNKKRKAYRLLRKMRKDKAKNKSILTICLLKMHKMKKMRLLMSQKTLRLLTITEVL